MRIAFYPMSDESWVAGTVVLKNLLYALKQISKKEEIKTFFVCSEYYSFIPEEIRTLVEKIIVIPNLNKKNPLRIIDYLIRRSIFYHLREKAILRQNKIDVVFGPTICSKYGKIPVLSFIHDFQHIHFPEMFSLQERLDRDKTFLKTAEVSSRILVHTESVKKDFQDFAPKYANKVRVIQFVNNVPESIYKADFGSILKLYNLPDKFIYLPNQFWKHKNHELVFSAIKVLKEKGIEVSVVCSGSPYDYRHPKYFTDLFQKLSEWNIREQVIYLGMIPYEHVLLLMRQCICVLNPSFFEGLGMTISEAISVGKQVLLSEIPAHREQNPPKATFFDPTNVEDLADKIERVWKGSSPGPDFELEDKARKELPNRIRECAQSFVSIAKEVI